MLHKSETGKHVLLFPDLKPGNIAKDGDTLVLFDLDAAPMQDPDEISLNINTLIAKWEFDAPTKTAPHYQSRLTSTTSLDLDTLRGQPSDSLHSLKQPSPPLTLDRLGGLRRQHLEHTPRSGTRSGIKKIAAAPYSQPFLRNT